jgi:hypothetical protein
MRDEATYESELAHVEAEVISLIAWKFGGAAAINS